MRRLLLAGIVLAGRAAAQDHGMPGVHGMAMPGMHMPAARPKPPARPRPPRPAEPGAGGRAGPARPAAAPPTPTPTPTIDPHAGHDMSAMPGMTPGRDAAAAGDEAGGTALPAGNAAAPAPRAPDQADRIWGADAMAASRAQLRREHGGGSFSQILFNLAEHQFRGGRGGYRWDGEGWFGGDIHRLVVKSEGRGGFGGGLDDAEVQALYSRAAGPYLNLRAGIRHDVRPHPSRTYATLGVEGLAPYWFEVGGALFLSDRGELLARAEGYADQRITQRLILQPRVEANFAAQDGPGNGSGSGLADVELGLRLRYEIAREFAPYVGLSHDRKLGDTARLARAAGEPVRATSLVLGVRTWF